MSHPPSSTTPPAKPSQLGPNIFLYIPTPCSTTNSSSPTTPAPELIIICSWMGAQTKHIDKYISGYQKLFPTSRILLLRNELLDIFLPSFMVLRRIQPALEVVLSAEKAAGVDGGGRGSSSNGINGHVPGLRQEPGMTKPACQPILLHAFSNGGSNMAVHLALLYARHQSRLPHSPSKPHPLPLHHLLLDSTPGTYADPATGVRAIMSTIPSYPTLSSRVIRLIAWLISWPLLTSLFMIQWTCGTENIVTLMRKRLNDPALFPLGTVPSSSGVSGSGARTYIFSSSDPLVSYRDVEAHADDAERCGFQNVRRERFEGTGHVAHVRGEGSGDGGERYWGIVRESWGA